jgi:hypothetical protein
MACMLVLASLTLCGCAAAPPASPPGAGENGHSPLGTPFSDEHYGAERVAPLIFDRGDLGLGTTVEFDRLPTASEMYDLQHVFAISHVVISLPAWPNEYAALDVLRFPPTGCDVIVLLPGYPPSRGASEIWNLLGSPVHIVMLVNGPPADPNVFRDLNTMRGLDRVIAEMQEPSRSGFERLQRPLSFRRVVR